MSGRRPQPRSTQSQQTMKVFFRSSATGLRNLRLTVDKNLTLPEFVQLARRKRGWTERTENPVLAFPTSSAAYPRMSSFEKKFRRGGWLILSAAHSEEKAGESLPETHSSSVQPQAPRRRTRRRVEANEANDAQNIQATNALHNALQAAFAEMLPHVTRRTNTAYGDHGVAGDLGMVNFADVSSVFRAIQIQLIRQSAAEAAAAAAAGNTATQRILSGGGGVTVINNHAHGSGPAGNGSISFQLSVPGLNDQQLAELNTKLTTALQFLQTDSTAAISPQNTATHLLERLRTAFGNADLAAQFSQILSTLLGNVRSQNQGQLEALADAIRAEAAHVSPSMAISALTQANSKLHQDMTSMESSMKTLQSTVMDLTSKLTPFMSLLQAHQLAIQPKLNTKSEQQETEMKEEKHSQESMHFEDSSERF